MYYGKLNGDGTLLSPPSRVTYNGYMYVNPSFEILRELGYKPIIDIPPENSSYMVHTVTYTEDATNIYAQYELHDMYNIDNVRADASTRSRRALDIYLKNHPYVTQDGKIYTCTEDKLNRLNLACKAYELKVSLGMTPVFKWNQKGQECVPHSEAEVTALIIGLTEYVEPYIEKQQAFDTLIYSTTDREVIMNMEFDYGDGGCV